MPGAAEGVLDVDVAVHRGAGFTLEVRLVAPPGVTILSGPSGAGKSTLLAAITGLVRPDRGHVRLGPETWFDAAAGLDHPVHARRVALVLQGLALFPHMTAEENVAYGVDRALPATARRARAREGLARFRAEHLVGRRPATFSGGEAQRVALARAFAMSPRLVLLDEPFSAMDPALRRALVPLVRELADDLAVPVLHVTHDPAEAEALGGRVLALQAGRLEDAAPDPSRAAREGSGAGPGGRC